jgi:predicted DNA binding CopG/RHH family protein
MTAQTKTVPLDQEEQDLLDALEHLDAKELPPPSPERQKMFREAAENFARKETSMNISMDAGELEELKRRAAVKGMKFPSFIKEVLHKYITGQLVEKKVC